MKKIFLFAILLLAIISFGCSRSTGARPPQGITTTGGAGTTGTTETGTASPTGTVGGSGGTTTPGEIVPSENSTSKPAVAGESDADSQITASVKQKFLDANLSIDEIQVSTQNGVVTLQGKVKDQATADSMTAKAKEVNGVKDVRSLLEVSK